MKKGFIAAIVVLLLTAIGGTVMASGNTEWNFDDHLPFMQQKHPDVADEELEEWFNDCSTRLNSEGEFGPEQGMGMMRGGMMGQGYGPGHGMGFGNRNGEDFPQRFDDINE